MILAIRSLTNPTGLDVMKMTDFPSRKPSAKRVPTEMQDHDDYDFPTCIGKRFRTDQSTSIAASSGHTRPEANR